MTPTTRLQSSPRRPPTSRSPRDLRLIRPRHSAVAALAFLVACGGGAPGGSQTDGAEPEATISAAPPASAAEVQQLGVRNVGNPAPGLITAAQVTQDQLDALVDMGYDHFISLRVTSEDGAGWEEAYADGADISFARIPVAGASGLTRENVEALDRLLDEAADEGTVLYCASSNRVGALLALRAYWLDGAEADQALQLGRDAGMRGLEGAVTELVSQPR